MKYPLKNENAGFTLLFASLVVALVLSIGLAIANITVTQLILSSAGKESQFAFYNADSGIECALYYEYNGDRGDGKPFFPSTDPTVLPSADSIVCAGKSPQYVTAELSGATTTTTFFINDPDNCVKEDPTFEVRVSRSLREDGFSTDVFIESRGYNTCDTSNPRRIERGLYAQFVD